MSYQFIYYEGQDSLVLPPHQNQLNALPVQSHLASPQAPPMVLSGAASKAVAPVNYLPSQHAPQFASSCQISSVTNKLTVNNGEFAIPAAETSEIYNKDQLTGIFDDCDNFFSQMFNEDEQNPLLENPTPCSLATIDRSGSFGSSIHSAASPVQSSEDWHSSLSPPSSVATEQKITDESLMLDFTIDEILDETEYCLEEQKLPLDQLVTNSYEAPEVQKPAIIGSQVQQQFKSSPTYITSPPPPQKQTPNQPNKIILIVPSTAPVTIRQPTAPVRRRKRKMSHSQVMKEPQSTFSHTINSSNSCNFLQPAKVAPVAEKDNLEFLSMNKKRKNEPQLKWQNLYDDEPEIEEEFDQEDFLFNPLESFAPSPASLSSSEVAFPTTTSTAGSSSVCAQRQERKRALNREAAHRYRKKQKSRLSLEEENYQAAYAQMKEAERNFNAKRSKLAVLRSLVLDLLDQP